MDAYLKIQSKQTNHSGTKNRLDFEIPANIGVLSLNKSYVSIEVADNTDLTGFNTNPLNSILRLNLDAGNAGAVYPNMASLVKHAHLTSQARGQLESIREVQSLRGTLDAYKKNVAEHSNDVGKLAHFQFDNVFNIHPTNNINKHDSTASIKTNHELRIPLKDIFDIAKTSSYDTSKYQMTNLHLEMNFENLNVAHGSGFSGLGNTKINNQAGSEEMKDFDNITATANNQDILGITTTGTYNNDDDVPFYVGQVLAVSSNNNGAGVATVNRVVSNIDRLNSNKLEVTFSQAIATLTTNGHVLSSISVDVFNTIDAGTDTVSINKCDLVLYRNEDEEAPEKLTYTTYMSDNKSYPVGTNAFLNFQIPPATRNIYVVFQSDGKRSHEQRLDNYRITVDNKDVTSRNVTMDSPQHYDLVSQAFRNAGSPVHSLLERQFLLTGKLAENDTSTEAGIAQRILACPVPFKASPQALQLELNASGGNLSGQLIVYYEQVRAK